MSEAAISRGRARLSAFRSAKASREATNSTREATTTTTTTTTTTEDGAEDEGGDVGVEGASGADAVAATEGVDDEARESETGEADGVAGTTGREATLSRSEMDVQNAYSMLADAYVAPRAEPIVFEEKPVEDAKREERRGGLGVTTSTDRAREQYERVMRAISGNQPIDSNLFDSIDERANGRTEEEEEEEEEEKEKSREACSDVDAIIEQVQRDGIIGLGPSRVVRDDQSEISMLQEVIDDMTAEKLRLVRGLQKSQSTVDELVNENDALTQRFNETKSQLSYVQGEYDRLWMQYQERLAASGDGDALAVSAPDANERVRALAAEVVNLEERVQDYDRLKNDNERLKAEAKRSNARASEAELILEATQEQQRMFKERMCESKLMKTLEKLEGDDAAFLCAWLKKKDFEVEARVKVESVSAERNKTDVMKDVVKASTSIEFDEEQIELLSSIDDLLEQLELEKKRLSKELTLSIESKQQLIERNALLESQLAKALNHLAREGTTLDEWSDEDETPRRRGLFSMFRRQR